MPDIYGDSVELPFWFYITGILVIVALLMILFCGMMESAKDAIESTRIAQSSEVIK